MPRKRRQSKKSSADEALPDQNSLSGTALGESQTLKGNSEVQGGSSLTSAQWTTLRKKLESDHRKRPHSAVFGASAKNGSVYRWGIASALDAACDDELVWLSRLATGDSVAGKRFRDIDPGSMVRRFEDALNSNLCEVSQASIALIWAAAMPGLLNHLDEFEWWSLLGTIQDFRDGILHRDPTAPNALVGVAEIGLTLATSLRALPSCRRLAISSKDAIKQWCEQDDLSLSAALARPQEARLVLASLIRTRLLLHDLPSEASSKSKRKSKSKGAKKSEAYRAPVFETAFDEIGVELTTWVASMTQSDGKQAFSKLRKRDVKDDLGASGLLMVAAELDPETLTPAMKAALGEGKTKGRLAWQVSLPDSMLHDEDAKVACLLPEWDVRRGRTVIDYGGQQTSLEISAGKKSVVSGVCETHLLVDGASVEPSGSWVATCEYSDDDVHYLELEQPHESGYVLQRQVMVIREDRCCLFADAVIEGQLRLDASTQPSSPAAKQSRQPKIEYQIRFPLADSIIATPEEHTTELFLGDDRPRAMVLPLSASEWRQSASTANIRVTDDRHLLFSTTGHGQLYAPLWFDLTRSRFRSKRTWRQLTVAQQLEILSGRDAAAFRVQVGKLQWILYRSLSALAPRTFVGKHMIADFYCARFDAKQESYEDLITVEDDPS